MQPFSWHPAFIPEGLEDVVRIAGSDSVSLALRADGTVKHWGYFQFGIAEGLEPLRDVIEIAAGLTHGLALLSNGEVRAAGENHFGQCDVPPGLRDVVAIAAGDFHSLALKSDGSVVAWGDNRNGQTTPPAGLDSVVAIAAGTAHTLALRADGVPIAWGFQPEPIPDGLDDIVAIDAAADFNVGRRRDGTLIAWGNSNSGGQYDIPENLGQVKLMGLASGFGVAVQGDPDEQSYDAWRIKHRLSVTQTRSGDSDADGMDNQLEQFLGSDPWMPDRNRLPSFRTSVTGELRFEFERPTSTSGVTYRVQSSTDLRRWDDLVPTVRPNGVPGWERVEWIAPFPYRDERFVRLLVGEEDGDPPTTPLP